MRLTDRKPDQLPTVFGGEFVHEKHRDEADRNLPPTDGGAIGIAALWLVFFALAVVSVGAKTLGKVVDVAMALGSSH
jgi:hypothetical protein